MWLFWDLVSALPIFPRSKALKQFNINIKTLGRWRWGTATPASIEERPIKLTQMVPKLLHLSLPLSLLPYLKGTATCQIPGRWSWISCCSQPQHAQSDGEHRPINKQITIYWATGGSNHVQNVLKAQRMDRMTELTVYGSDLWHNFQVQVGIFWITKEWEAPSGKKEQQEKRFRGLK